MSGLLGRHRFVQAVGVERAAHDRVDADATWPELLPGRLRTAGRLRCTVTEHVAFDELPKALQRLANREVIGKLVLDAP